MLQGIYYQGARGQQVDMDDRYERMDAINVAKYAVEKDGAHSALVRHEKVIFTIMQD